MESTSHGTRRAGVGVACGVPSRCIALAPAPNRYISAPPASPCLTCALAHRASASVLKRHAASLGPEQPRRTMGRGDMCAQELRQIHRPPRGLSAGRSRRVRGTSRHLHCVRAPNRPHALTNTCSHARHVRHAAHDRRQSVRSRIPCMNRLHGSRRGREHLDSKEAMVPRCQRLRTQATVARVQHISVQDGAHGRRTGHL